MYSPARRDALKAAKLDDKYFCGTCKKVYDKWAMDIDHIAGCSPLTDFHEVGAFVQDLFTGQLVAICKNCHRTKTKDQRKAKKHK